MAEAAEAPTPSFEEVKNIIQDPTITNDPTIKTILTLSKLHFQAKIDFLEKIQDPKTWFALYETVKHLKESHDQDLTTIIDYPSTPIQKLQNILFTQLNGNEILRAFQYESRSKLAKTFNCTPDSLDDGTCSAIKDIPFFADKDWARIYVLYGLFKSLFANDIPYNPQEITQSFLSQAKSTPKSFTVKNIRILIPIKNQLDTLANYAKEYIEEKDWQLYSVKSSLYSVKSSNNAVQIQTSLQLNFQAPGEDESMNISLDINTKYNLLKITFNFPPWDGLFVYRVYFNDSRSIDELHYLPSNHCWPEEPLCIQLALEFARLKGAKSLTIPSYVVSWSPECRRSLLADAGFKKESWFSKELIYKF